jgi:hypothetical protein
MNYSKKMNIENLITKKNRLDRRYKLIVELERWFNKYTLASAMWSLIITSTAWCYLSDRTSLQPLKPTIMPKVEVVEAKAPDKFCDDPISYIRCLGEKLGKTNQEITTMIRIAKCESGYREDATNFNNNKTLDRGIFQLNSIHKDISHKDAFDYKKNIEYAWNMETNQGFNPWNSSIKCWNK